MIPALAKYLERLAVLKAELANAGLHPSKETDKTSYGYGLACGIQQGIEHAEKLVDEVLRDLERRDD